MSCNPKLSIIIPTYNSGSVLKRAIDSVMSQSFQDWEVLVMDGGSNDETVQIAKSYCDERIIINSEPDQGVYDAMNKGLLGSRGEWLYFLGSDDWLLNDHVLERIFTIEDLNYDVIYGDVEFSHLDESFHGEWSKVNIYENRCHQAIFYKKKLLNYYHGYDLRYRIWSDYDLNLKWFFSKKFRHLYIDVIIAHFSDSGLSSNQIDVEFEKRRDYIFLTRGWKFFDRSEKIVFAKECIRKSNGRLDIVIAKFLLCFLRIESVMLKTRLFCIQR